MLEVKELVKLLNLCIHHGMIQSEFGNIIRAKVAASVIRNHGPGRTQPGDHGFMSGLGNNPVLVTWVGVIGGS